MVKNEEFIEFPYFAQQLMKEVAKRHASEINQHLTKIYEELSLTERMKEGQKSGERFELKSDFSGVFIIAPDKPKEK